MFKRVSVLFAGLALLLAAQTTDVDSIIELMKGGMSESLLLKTIQRQGKTYNLTPTEMVKLQKAGASEKIIEALMDPAASPAAPAETAQVPTPAAAIPPAAPTATPQPSTQAAGKKEEKKRGGFFSGIGDSLGRAARNTVDSTKSTVDKTAQDTSSNVSKTVQDSASQTESKVNSTVQGAVGTPAQKPAAASNSQNNSTAKRPASSPTPTNK